jgi:uncharacterized protein YbaA (DUF1428 family)
LADLFAPRFERCQLKARGAQSDDLPTQEEQMANYVDGFVIPIPKNKVAAYKKIAAKAAKVWKKYGAIDYFEAVGDDLKNDMGVSFPKMAKTKPNETVIFSWITYKSKAHRNAVNKKVMKDPWVNSFDPSKMPFDHRNMAFGGFKVLVKSRKK